VRTDEHVVAEYDRPVSVARCGGTQHRVLGDDTRLADGDVRRLGVQHSPVHDAGPRTNPDVTNQGGSGRNIRGVVDCRRAATMSDQHA
jgi:hypothetical protein